MMKVFSIIWEDTHVDTEVQSFYDIEEAMEYLTKGLKECYVDNGRDFTVNENIYFDNDLTWLFSVYGESFSMRLGQYEVR